MSRSRAVVSRRSRITVCRDRRSRCRGDRGSRCVTLEDRGVSRLRIEDRGVANNYKRPKFCPVRRSIFSGSCAFELSAVGLVCV